LLNWIETDCLKPGQCITRVFLNAGEEVNYRSAQICEQDIAVVGPVRIESGDFDDVVRESLEELDAALKSSIECSHQIVRLLEMRREPQAYNRLAQLLDSMRIFFTIFSEDLGWIDAPDAEIYRPDFCAALDRALSQLTAAQVNRYGVAVRDVLQYDIDPILESWQKLVERTRVHAY
jgi:hypothetical protein